MATETAVKFTPGPWRANGPDSSGTFTVGDKFPDYDGTRMLACVYAPEYDKFPVSSTECEANARLIAASPQMYEALRDAYALLGTMGDILNDMDVVTPEEATLANPVFEKVRAALRAAEGA